MKHRTTHSSERARARRVDRYVTQRSVEPERRSEAHEPTSTPGSLVMTRHTAETAAALLTIDTIAEGSLPSRSILRYRAYRQALLESEPDIQWVIVTLSMFVWDLFKRRSSTTLH